MRFALTPFSVIIPTAERTDFPLQHPGKTGITPAETGFRLRGPQGRHAETAGAVACRESKHA